MLKRCIIAENRKLHASPIWVIFFVLPLISAGYGTFNYLQNLEILTERWYSLWTQHTLFYSMLFFPAMVSAYAAYLWRLEHLGHNWNLIMAAPVRPFALFAAKLLVVVKLMCCWRSCPAASGSRATAGHSPCCRSAFPQCRRPALRKSAPQSCGSAWPAKAAPPPQPDRRKCRAPDRKRCSPAANR
ncbi:MAG: ABC transporter permease [Gemmiger formicilis]|uniref:ABC transporter permease n=1 Tax=Gemmiger formicilis TaxID=745368 RepID=UPI003FEFE703|nr:ABC transporter permease [Gemmiger formicilis]